VQPHGEPPTLPLQQTPQPAQRWEADDLEGEETPVYWRSHEHLPTPSGFGFVDLPNPWPEQVPAVPLHLEPVPMPPLQPMPVQVQLLQTMPLPVVQPQPLPPPVVTNDTTYIKVFEGRMQNRQHLTTLRIRGVRRMTKWRLHRQGIDDLSQSQRQGQLGGPRIRRRRHQHVRSLHTQLAFYAWYLGEWHRVGHDGTVRVNGQGVEYLMEEWVNPDTGRLQLAALLIRSWPHLQQGCAACRDGTWRRRTLCIHWAMGRCKGTCAAASEDHCHRCTWGRQQQPGSEGWLPPPPEDLW